MNAQRPPRTLGTGHDEFWARCAKDELCMRRCSICQSLQWPIAPVCEHCGNGTFGWELMSGKGTLASWCTFHQDYYRGLMPVPYDTILVRLEEGPLFISDPEGFGRTEMKLGMTVMVSFIDAEDSAGAFRLPVFSID